MNVFFPSYTPVNRDQNPSCIRKSILVDLICAVAGVILFSLAASKLFGPAGGFGYYAGLTGGAFLVYTSICCALILLVKQCKKSSNTAAVEPQIPPSLSNPTPREISLFHELAPELRLHVLRFMSYTDLRKTLRTDREYAIYAKEAIIERAKDFGYSMEPFRMEELDEKFKLARTYIRSLFKVIHKTFVVEAALSGTQFTTPPQTDLELEALALSLRSLTVEDIYALYSRVTDEQKIKDEDLRHDTVFSISLLTNYLLKMVRSGEIQGKIAAKTSISLGLVFACIEGEKELVELMLRIGVDPNSGTSVGSTPLQFAAQQGHSEIVTLLIQYGALVDNPQSGRTALNFALGPTFVTKLEVRDFLAPPHLMTDNIYKEKHEAQIVETVKVLLENGADPNLCTQRENTPLHMAADLRFPTLVALLLESGAQVNTQNVKGETALWTAISHFRPITDYSKLIEIVSLLIKNGADPEIADHDGKTPFTCALSLPKEVFALLLDFIPNINALHGSSTLLHWATCHLFRIFDDYTFFDFEFENHNLNITEVNTLKIINLLFEKGADPNIPSIDGTYPLHTAADELANSMIVQLLQRHAQVNVVDANGHTPLISALKCNKSGLDYDINVEKVILKTIKLLIEVGGADPNYGVVSPLKIAVKKNYYQIVEYLVGRGASIQSEETAG